MTAIPKRRRSAYEVAFLADPGSLATITAFLKSGICQIKKNYEGITIIIIVNLILLTHSWMYWRRKGEARKLSTGQSKKPWISF